MSKEILMEEKLTVADIFCGAGGFSEGFSQAGFEIKFAIDHWEFARKTHELNHPNCEHSSMDILDMEPEEIKCVIPDVHVIIGSPPCVSFSSSNRAGKADKTNGVKMIEKYFQIIAIKKYMPSSILKYWIMENVPNSQKNIKSKYTFHDLGLSNEILQNLNIEKKESDTALEIDISKDNIYNSVEYGVPQRRKRFFCGDFPKLKKLTPDQSGWTTLGEVISALNNNNVPNPDIDNPIVTDPNYGFSIPDDDLTDHYYDTTIHPFGWEQAQRKKCHARYYGRMSFPEDESKPSRTVLATRSTGSRESMVIGTDGTEVYRALTIREAATLMSFPISYQFQAANEPSKYRLVGNAVCPKLAYEFAKVILEKKGFTCERNLKTEVNKNELLFDLRGLKNGSKLPRNKHELANFAEIVPDLKHNNFRVELDNNFPRSGINKLKWTVSIHHATGRKNMKVARPTKKVVTQIFYQLEDEEKVNQFIKETKRVFAEKIPNAGVFQSQNCSVEPLEQYFTPGKSLNMVAKLVDKYFPLEEYRDVVLSNKIDGGKRDYIKFNDGKIPHDNIPIRIIAALYASIHISELTKSTR